MRYRDIEYTVVQGIKRGVWKWSVLVAGTVVSGQEPSKAAAVVTVEKGHRPGARFKKVATCSAPSTSTMGYVCLPVHDSFIVHHALQDELTTIMRDEFHKEAGANIDTKTKFDVSSVTTTSNRVIPMDELMFPMGEYAGYESRLLNWWASRG